VILLYLESFGNPAKFSRIARRVSRDKPIVALKAGRSAAGARAAASHTGALATSDTFVDALFHQSGVVRTDTVTELFDVAMMLSRQPLPRGRRIAILTNAGGPGILAADACQAHGLTVTELTEPTRTALRAILPAAASVNNPVDMLASAPAAHYEQSLRIVLADPNVDAVIVIFIPPVVTAADDVAAAIARAAAVAPHKPMSGVFMRSAAAPVALAAIPCFAFPEPAAIAMARVADYAQWRRHTPGVVPALDGIDAPLARRSIARALQCADGWLTTVEAQALLSAAGIATPPSMLAASIDEAVIAAERLGYPVAVKAVGRELLHKTEHKAIRLNLQNRNAVREAAASLTRSLGGRMEGLLVQRMISGGVEMMIGAINDSTFGHVIVAGAGGILVELLADAASRLHPLTDVDAAEMADSLKVTRLLRGYRGAAPLDEPAFVDTLLRLSALITICPEIEELDVNPLMVLASGVSAPDVRVRVVPRA
jgi:acyl-CoA synthetase (NDP forming)